MASSCPFIIPLTVFNSLGEGHEGPTAGSFLFTLKSNNAAAGLGVYNFGEKLFPSETLLKQKPDTSYT
jgi:hypothetical protein